jgi:hypothetical protein
MIDAKKAVEAAKRSAAENLGGSSMDYSLEEMELETYKGRNVWMITLGMKKKAPPIPPNMAPLAETMGSLFGPPRDREYKRFFVDAETGNLIAMKLGVQPAF